MRFVSYQDRKKIAADMRTIYTAPSVEAAEIALKDLDQQWGTQYPGVIVGAAAACAAGVARARAAARAFIDRDSSAVAAATLN